MGSDGGGSLSGTVGSNVGPKLLRVREVQDVGEIFLGFCAY